MGPAVGATNSSNGIPSSACNNTLSRTINSSSHVNNTLLPSNIFGGIMGSHLGATATVVSSQEALLDGANNANNTSGWTLKELAGAILFAGAATAGSMLLGPIDRIVGKPTGGGGGGGGGSGGNNGGPVGGKYEHSFESPAKEKEDQEEKLGVGIATVPRPYEVSVRALRGGRLSMEDEFVVASGGRLSAVFDGHGGGGVSQYLRDRLHVIISEQLHQHEKSQNSNGKFRGDLKRFVFGKGLQGKKHAQSQGDDSTEDTADTGQSASRAKKYDISNVGQLPVSAVAAALKDAFDQVDKEILINDEYEYQGSTAVATLLHEANDGTRTLLSANIGDSRGVLSRNGRAIDLTRDHKPNDDKEKARILAMGEKIEWDHYCKVHRVRNLSLSRAIGDRFAKPAVSGEVEIKRFPIYDDKDEFIVLASDGLWDVMSSQEVVSYTHKRLNAPPKDGADITCEEDMASLKYLRRKNMSRFIANEALRRGSGDNISVVIVWLTEFDPILPLLK